MCGFTVCIRKRKDNHIRDKVTKSLRNLAHRGPDFDNILEMDNITFGHCRLSIIDLSNRSNQPLVSGNSRYVIVFNGEIYNYKEIRSLLSGWDFRTESDTEVLLAAYDLWGDDCFNKFIGQFSVCIFDRNESKVIISRDRMGEKPLFYFEDEIGIYFSSEIRGLLPFFRNKPTINFQAYYDYLHFQYVPEPLSIIENIFKVEAGSIVEIDANNFFKEQKRFWSWLSPEIDEKPVEICDVEKSMRKAVEYSLVADVPIGMGLSAGLDSAAIAFFAKDCGVDIATYTVGYPGRPDYDERSGAAELAKYLGLKNTQIEIEPNDFISNFDEYCDALSEPIADTAGYGHYMVPKVISSHGHKVALSGIGGDEIFWGYEWTRLAIQFENSVKVNVPEKFIKMLRTSPKLLKLIFMLSKTRRVSSQIRPYFRFLHTLLVSTTPRNQRMFMGISGAPEFSSLVDVGGGYIDNLDLKCVSSPYRYTEDLKSTDDIIINLLSKLNRTWLMYNCVQLSDSLSMASSIESRAPFLNSNLISTSLSYNLQHRPDLLGSKVVLKNILSKKLPSYLLERPKSGFITPIGKWVPMLENRYAESLNRGRLFSDGLIRKNILTGHESVNITIHSKYRLILLEVWYNKLIDKYYDENN